MITSQITHERTIITHKPLQKSLPYKEEVMYVPFYRGLVLQRGYGLGSIFKSVARSVMPSSKEMGKSAMTDWIGSIARCGKGRECQNSGKKTTEGKQSGIPRRYCF